MRSLLAVGFVLTLSAVPASAQRQRCGTVEPGSWVTTSQPSDCGYLTNSPQPRYEPSCDYDIQVVFHVIQNNSGVGFLSAATIQDQIDVLNEDFNALPGSPGAPGAEARIRFHLATVDPDGNPTTGITYSNNNNWFQDNGNYWSSLAWDTSRYLNIYTNAVPCCYGYISLWAAQGAAGAPPGPGGGGGGRVEIRLWGEGLRWNLLPTTYYPPPTTYYLLLTTNYLPLPLRNTNSALKLAWTDFSATISRRLPRHSPVNSIRLGLVTDRKTRCVADSKSSSCASKMLSTHFCGFLSTSGNQVL